MEAKSEDIQGGIKADDYILLTVNPAPWLCETITYQAQVSVGYYLLKRDI